MSESLLTTPGAVQHVLIGEIRVASHGFLKSTLGSCVAIALIDRKRAVCALAHCLLPYAPEGAEPVDARYADRALPNLLRLGPWSESGTRGLAAFLAGGARMTPDKSLGRPSVGDMNVSAAQSTFDLHRIRYKVLQVGGTAGYSVVVDCEALTLTCNTIKPMTTEPEGEFHGIESSC